MIEQTNQVYEKTKGLVEVRDLQVGDFILGINYSGEDDWKEVVKVETVDVSKKEQIEIITYGGTLLNTSSNFPITILSSNNTTYTPNKHKDLFLDKQVIKHPSDWSDEVTSVGSYPNMIRNSYPITKHESELLGEDNWISFGKLSDLNERDVISNTMFDGIVSREIVKYVRYDDESSKEYYEVLTKEGGSFYVGKNGLISVL